MTWELLVAVIIRGSASQVGYCGQAGATICPMHKCSINMDVMSKLTVHGMRQLSAGILFFFPPPDDI